MNFRKSFGILITMHQQSLLQDKSEYGSTSGSETSNQKRPLADLLRPGNLKDYEGQEKLVGKDGPIRRMIEKDDLISIILWGPPGSGKTTLARIIANETSSYFVQLSAVKAGKADVEKAVREAREIFGMYDGKRTILFLDEIHRFNKAQQDYLLPFVEDGTLILIGATTENPSFEVNSALLSRMRVFVLDRLTAEEIQKVVNRAIKLLKSEYKISIKLDKEAMTVLVKNANGDPRSALNILELSIKLSKSSQISREIVLNAIAQSPLYYDKTGEEHYNIISALHKSMRSSDANASLYWLARMLEGGEQPEYIARRMLRFAAEDIGNAEPMATVLAESVFEACKKIGLPECKVHLAQLAIFLAKAPKDNSAYVGYAKASKDAKETLNLPVPMHLRNAPTDLMKELGYGKNYIYDHNVKGKKSGQQCMPDELKNRKYL